MCKQQKYGKQHIVLLIGAKLFASYLAPAHNVKTAPSYKLHLQEGDYRAEIEIQHILAT